MSRPLLTLLAASAIAAATVPATASAQLTTSISVAGGLSAPLGTLKTFNDAGYNAAAALNLGAPLIPIGIRLEGGYNSFNYRQSLSASGKVQILSGTANAVVYIGPTGASPYLIGGVGMYKRNESGTSLTSGARTVGGVNGGAGIRFPLGVMSPFIEARYHKLLGNASDGTDYSYLPITFGISF